LRPFKLKLADGSLTTDDHHKVCVADLHSDDIAALRDAVTKDAITPPAVDGSSLFVFERTGLGIKDQETFMRGRLLEFVHARGGTDPVPVMSLYETLRGSVLTKTGVTQEFTTEAEFYDLKTLCRADIEAMFLRATRGGRFHESWAIIQMDLIAAGVTPLQAL
jgi:hypothetical protein